MSLRARLLAGLVLVMLVLISAGFAVAYVQRSYLIGQLDDQLEALVPNARVAATRPGADNLPRGQSRVPITALADAYVGVLDANGRLMTVIVPTDDPLLVPDLSAQDVRRGAFTTDAASGEADRVRVLMAAVGPGRSTNQVLVIALATTRAEQAFRSLIITTLFVGLIVAAVLGVVAWWVERLGLRPIRQMTRSADAIAGGDTDSRVDVPHGDHEAARLGRALNMMIDTNRASEARLRRFVADVSHELRTPLTTLRGYAELATSATSTAVTGAEDVPAPVDPTDGMRRIREEAARMSRMVDDLLLLAELDERRPMERDPVDVVPLLHDLAADMAVVQPDRPVTVEVPDSLVVRVDRDRLTQAVTAFTTNAMRHTPTSAPVTLRATSDGGGVRIEVADRGPGIPAADRPHLFERFYRVDKSRSRASGGNGLGLAIVAGIVEAHGGRFGVDAPPEGGSTFWFTLPPA